MNTPTHVRWLTRNVVAIGLLSLFSDMGHELTTAVLPLFLATFGGGAAALGVIEGVSDAASSLLEAVDVILLGSRGKAQADSGGGLSGHGHDGRLRVRHRVVAIAGDPSDCLDGTRRARACPQRAALGKRAARGPRPGLRIRGRDGHAWRDSGACHCAVARRRHCSSAHFPDCIHPRCDHGLHCVVCDPGSRRECHGNIYACSRRCGICPRCSGVSCAPSESSASAISLTLCLVLRAVSLLTPQYGPVVAGRYGIALYILHNVLYAAVSYPAGALGDRVNKKTLLAAGYAMFGAMCLLFLTNPTGIPMLALLFSLAGVYVGIVDGMERALAADLLPIERRGVGYGALATANSFGDLLSSVVVGLLWSHVSFAAGFGYAAVLTLAGAFFLLLVPTRERR